MYKKCKVVVNGSVKEHTGMKSDKGVFLQKCAKFLHSSHFAIDGKSGQVKFRERGTCYVIP